MAGKRLSGEEVLLEVPRLYCPGHGELLRPHWPSAQLMVMGIELFQAAAEGQGEESLWAAVREATGEETPSPQDINIITRKRPLCYFVERNKLRALYQAHVPLKIGRCQACGRNGMGGAYQVGTPKGTHDSWLCVECVLETGESYHRAHPRGGVWPEDTYKT